MRVHTIVISVQHDETISLETMRRTLKDRVIQAVVPAKYLDEKTIYHLQPSGRFVIGGPQVCVVLFWCFYQLAFAIVLKETLSFLACPSQGVRSKLSSGSFSCSCTWEKHPGFHVLYSEVTFEGTVISYMRCD